MRGRDCERCVQLTWMHSEWQIEGKRGSMERELNNLSSFDNHLIAVSFETCTFYL